MSSVLDVLKDLWKFVPGNAHAAAIISAVLLHLPQILPGSRAAQLVEKYDGILCLVFLAALAVAVERYLRRAGRAVEGYLARRRLLQSLHGLAEDEKDILRPYVVDQVRSSSHSIENGAVQRLVAAGTLVRCGGPQNIYAMPHYIGDMAWKHLQENPAILEPSASRWPVAKDNAL